MGLLQFCSLSEPHLLYSQPHMKHTHIMVSEEYFWSLQHQLFTPLCLTSLYLPLQCWATLFYKARCCSRLHLGKEAQVTSALCSLPLPSDAFKLSKCSSCSGWESTVKPPSSQFLCSFFLPTTRNYDFFLYWENFFWLTISFSKSIFYSMNFII